MRREGIETARDKPDIDQGKCRKNENFGLAHKL